MALSIGRLIATRNILKSTAASAIHSSSSSSSSSLYKTRPQTWESTSLIFNKQSSSLHTSATLLGAVESNDVLPSMIITDRAAARLNMINSSKDEPQYLRVMVDSGGCSGFAYQFNLVDKADFEEDDSTFEHNGASIVVDEISLEYMDGSTIDYTMELIKRAFVVAKNPNAEDGCGCGISFSLK